MVVVAAPIADTAVVVMGKSFLLFYILMLLQYLGSAHAHHVLNVVLMWSSGGS